MPILGVAKSPEHNKMKKTVNLDAGIFLLNLTNIGRGSGPGSGQFRDTSVWNYSGVIPKSVAQEASSRLLH